MMMMMAQAQRFGARFLYETVTSVSRQPDGTFVLVTDGATHQAQSVIIATGASPRHLGLPNEQKLIGHGLTSCATCDGAFYRDVPVAVIGGGDSACEEAGFLTRFASTVHLIHRRDSLRASKIMAERVLANPKVKPIWNSVVTEYLPDANGEMNQVRLQNVADGTESLLDVKCIFVAIGHIPNTQFLGDLVDLDENGYILHRTGMMTNVPGLFAAGDVADHVWRQAVTAAGQGCAAAIEAERYLAATFGES
jgi:thioredoxin reductase (NADPH)